MRNAKGKSAINSSILKFDLSGHRLEILEYCKKVKAVVLAREQYYINLFKPEYNLLQMAGSPLGYKHTEETRAKMSAARATVKIIICTVKLTQKKPRLNFV